MKAFSGKFATFFVSVFDNWVGKMSGGVGLVLMFAARFWRNDTVPSSWLWAASIAALVVAFFNAWLKQYNELETYRHDVPLLVVPPGGLYADLRHFTVEHVTHPWAVTTTYAPPLGVQVFQTTISRPMLHLRLRNEAKTRSPSERSFARKVSATVVAYDPNGREIFEMHGRWSDSPQPGDLPADRSVTDILAADFNLGQSREIDLCVIDTDGTCYGFNNDSYPAMIDTRWRMPGSLHFLHVRVQGVLIDQTWAITFATENGAFCRIRCEEISNKPTAAPA